MQKAHLYKIWPLGFLGFLSLRFFSSHHYGDLWFIAFFGFFSYYFIGKISATMTDELLLANANKAKVKTLGFPLTALFVIGFLYSQNLLNKGWVIALLGLSFSLTLILYAFLFNRYEKDDCDD